MGFVISRMGVFSGFCYITQLIFSVSSIFVFSVIGVIPLSDYISLFLIRDAFVRTNHRAIAMMFVRPSVSLGRACIVIIRCTLALI